MAYGIASRKQTLVPGAPVALPDPSGNLETPDVPGGVASNPDNPYVLPEPTGYQAPTGSLPQVDTGYNHNADDATKVGDINALTLPVDQTREPAPAPAATNGPMDIIARSLQSAYGRAPTAEDVTYWMGKWNEWGSKDPNYFEQRLLGLGAGGKDVATAGPYAGQDYDKIWADNTNLFDPSMSAAALKSAMTPATTTANANGLPADAADPNVDPFAATGGGVYANGGWQPTGMATAGGGADTTTTTGTDGGVKSGTVDNSSASIDDSYRTALKELLSKPERSPEDLQKSPENRAFELSQQRSEERQRGQLAERAFAEGTDASGAFDTDLQGIRQNRGEQEAGFLGELSMQEHQAKRQDLQYAITTAQNAGQFDKVQQLQRELADIDAAIRRESIAASREANAGQLNLGGQDIDLRRQLGLGSLELQRLAAALQNQQFGQSLGYNYTALQENSNANALRAIFGND